MKKNRNSIVYRLFRRKRKPRKGLYEDLSAIRLFADLNEKELYRLEQVLYLRSYKKGESVFREGTPGYAFFILREGVIHLYRESSGGDTKSPVIINPGQMLGELVILCATDRNFSALAAGDCEMAVLFKHDFMDFVHAYPRTGVKILLAMSRLMGERYLDLLESLEQNYVIDSDEESQGSCF